RPGEPPASLARRVYVRHVRVLRHRVAWCERVVFQARHPPPAPDRLWYVTGFPPVTERPIKRKAMSPARSGAGFPGELTDEVMRLARLFLPGRKKCVRAARDDLTSRPR